MAGTIWAVDNFVGYEGMMPVPDDLGCKVYVTSEDDSTPAVTGWYELGDPRVDSTDKPAGDGTLDGFPTQPGRAVTIVGRVRAPDQLTLLMWIDRFNGLLMSGDRTGVLAVQEPHMTRYLPCRRGGEAIATPTKTRWTATFSMILYGQDPRRLGDPLTDFTPLPSVTGGLTVPFTVPFAIRSRVISGRVALTNPGTSAGPVTLRIDGPTAGDPLVGPVVTHVASGKQLTISTNFALTIGAFLLIDMEAESVLSQGQEPIDEFVISRGFSQFDPGGNIWAFTAQSGSGLLTVTATPAW